MEQFLQTETGIIGILLIMAILVIVARRLSGRYSVTLVLVGLIISLQQQLDIEMTPEPIRRSLAPLLFENELQLVNET